ncbi:acyl carrier protein [Symbioplanes lichenis]|uniref:acyl carrier protein n=1 Tax=Symbioplanes lichenis TaxID=1629072 RepID=UPI0027392717|nr:acyl carrier protein [Actinoplanes lichenis]
MASTTEFIIHVLRDKMQMPTDGVSPRTPLGTGGLDLESIGFTELAMHCEEGLGVAIPDDELGLLPGMTVQGLAGYLDARAAAGV